MKCVDPKNEGTFTYMDLVTKIYTKKEKVKKPKKVKK